jgi:hypothetical protein
MASAIMTPAAHMANTSLVDNVVKIDRTVLYLPWSTET